MSPIEPQPQAPSNPTPRDSSTDPTARWSVPSWAISAIFHIIVFLAIALWMSTRSPQGAAVVRTAEVGIVLKQQTADEETIYDSPELQQARAESHATAQGAADMQADVSADEIFSDAPPSDPSNLLPKAFNVIGAIAAPGTGDGDARNATAGGGMRGSIEGGIGGKGRTSVFGLPGEGYSFCYVFDRSASMGGNGRSPLATAKAQLLASLNSLEKNHQFQIIFYNQSPARFNPLGDPNQLFFATDRNRKLAMNFIQSIVADGSTDHEPALLMAINMQPDVIFFLTDADDPQLTPRQMQKVRMRAKGICINTIEFGIGQQQHPDNFLVRLAQENSGAHKYVDITRFSSTGGADQYDTPDTGGSIDADTGTQPGSGNFPGSDSGIPDGTLPVIPSAPFDFDFNNNF